jgi:hypothetical protein
VFEVANFLGDVGVNGWGEFYVTWADVDLHGVRDGFWVNLT